MVGTEQMERVAVGGAAAVCLRVSVLGRLRAWVHGSEIDLGPARQRAVFAVLAARAGRAVGRDELVEAVWGASPPATAVGSVYTYVCGLRRRLQPDPARPPAGDLLTSTPHGYVLRLPGDALDAAVFERWRAEAAAKVAAGDAEGAIGRLGDALRLWHGDPYAGLRAPHLEWERERLTELRLAAAEQWARLLLDRGRDDGLVAELAGLARANCLHEPVHELLIRALHRAGRHADALVVFRRLRRTLREELGVEPGPALRAAYRRVLAAGGRPPARAEAAPASAARGHGRDHPVPFRHDLAPARTA
ncbi:BTAD domain-containing putative transcriptional regulator [Micromonospora haikouensis]|uniref:AfsR/SARP family transcriptional regulator n=1 Tax=Micromonospora haikouensis TaxID=686309 RepID=UPI0037A1A5DD